MRPVAKAIKAGTIHTVRQAFLDIAASDPNRCQLIDGTATIEMVAANYLEEGINLEKTLRQ